MTSDAARISEIIAPVFHPVHREIREGKYSEYWLRGGRGSTKSSFVSIEIILGLMRDPNANAIVYRKVAATLRESVFEQLVWAADALGVSQYFKMRVSPLEIEYKPTGQKILFRGADDPKKSKSIKLRKGYFRYLWFEEAAEFAGMDGIRTIKASILRGMGSDAAISFFSYNPPMSARDWVNAEVIKPVKGRRVHDSCYLDVPAHWLGEAFIAEAENLKSTNERAYRHMYLGEITGTGGQVFDNLELRRIAPEECDRLGAFYNGLDFGFAVDPDAFTRWAYDKRTRVLYAMDEYVSAHNSIERIAEEAKKRAGRDVVRCDSADPRMIDELRRRGIAAVSVKKGPGSVAHGIRWLQDLGKIVIDPEKTPHIAKEFSGYEYRQDKEGNFIPEYPDERNHTIDSCRYSLNDVIAQKKLSTISKGSFGL